MKQIPKQMTKKETAFFKTPKTMEQITIKLFNGDPWAANHFQTDMLNSKQLVIEFTKDMYKRLVFKLP